jgi:signal peptidase I
MFPSLMPEGTQLSLGLPTAEASIGAASAPTQRRVITAGFMSGIVPGAGHLLVGRWGEGMLLLTLMAMLLVCFWPLRLLRFYPGLVILYLAWITIFAYAPCSAQLGAGSTRGRKPSGWWLVGTISFALLSLSLLGKMVTRASGFRTFTTPSAAMEGTLWLGDSFVVDLRSRNPGRRDVVVFSRGRNFFVKRVLAIEGDVILGRNGAIFVDGMEQIEPYARHIGTPLPWMTDFGPFTIPRDSCFVAGDNRDMSMDSRSPDFGLVNNHSIVGKVLYVFASNRMGRKVQ